MRSMACGTQDCNSCPNKPLNIGLMSSAIGMSAIASFLQKRRPLLQCNSLVSASKDGAESELLLPVAGLMCDTLVMVLF